jgi:hypothetical protein
MAIDVFHGRTPKGAMRKTLLVIGPQSYIAHDIIEQVGSIGTKPVGNTPRALDLTEGNTFLVTLILKVRFICIGTDGCDTDTLLNKLPGNTTP